MNKLLISFAFVALIGGSGCKKNNLVIDKDPLIPPQYAELVLPTFTAKSYFITSDPATEFKIPVGITNVTNADRTIQFTYTSATAVQGTQYTAPASITIPAGKALDTLRIKGIFANYPSGRKDIVKVKITGGSAPAFVGKDSVNVILQKFCPVVLNALLGNYSRTNELLGTGAYGPYTTSVSSVTRVGPTKGKIVVENIFDYGWGPITFDLDWADPDPNKFTTTVVTQTSGIADGGTIDPSYAGKEVMVRPFAGQSGTFDACDNTITLKMQIGVVGVGYLNSLYTVTMKR